MLLFARISYITKYRKERGRKGGEERKRKGEGKTKEKRRKNEGKTKEKHGEDRSTASSFC